MKKEKFRREWVKGYWKNVPINEFNFNLSEKIIPGNCGCDYGCFCEVEDNIEINEVKEFIKRLKYNLYVEEDLTWSGEEIHEEINKLAGDDLIELNSAPEGDKE